MYCFGRADEVILNGAADGRGLLEQRTKDPMVLRLKKGNHL